MRAIEARAAGAAVGAERYCVVRAGGAGVQPVGIVVGIRVFARAGVVDIGYE
jgi:hypothetical protein